MGALTDSRMIKSYEGKTDGSAGASAQDVGSKFHVARLNFYYGAVQALYDVSLEIRANRITALIGPSGCGKSTFLRALNRMYETVRHARAEGEVLLDGVDIFSMDVVSLRRRVGMVFQKSNPFPKTIFDNVAYGLRVNGVPRRESLSEAVEASLRRAALWDEVKDQLHNSALALSGGQQQRL
ncbi:MAG: phosphate ABC transporter ATP-binding protein, partial [Terriglobia bacterium]